MLKRILPRGLFARGIIIIVSPVILLQIVAGFVFYDRLLESVTERLTRGVSGDVNFVLSMLGDLPEPSEPSAFLSRASLHMNLLFRVEEGTFTEVHEADGPRSPLETVVHDTLAEALAVPFTFENRPDRKIVELHLPAPRGTMVVLVPHNRMFARGTNLLVYWTLGSSFLLLAIAILFLRNQVRPIRQLAQAADQLGRGQEVRNFKPSGALEVRQAASAFLRMRDRIDRQIRQRTEMLAGVSHDLRTPLTRMKLALAMMGDAPDVQDLKSDVVDMERMVDGYLLFARGAGGEPATPTDISALLQEVVEAACRADDNVTLQVQGDLNARVRPQSLKRCLANLVSNAQRYGEHVQVMATRRKDAIEITVDDDGPGIPAEEREAVFRPFYRLDASRNRETGGVGLGLSIARDTVRSQGGDVTLDQSPQGGLRAIVRLPV